MNSWIPADRYERAVAAVWERALGIDGIGPDDDFFELGGNSVLAVTIMRMLEAEFGYGPKLDTLFREPTVAALAKRFRDSDV